MFEHDHCAFSFTPTSAPLARSRSSVRSICILSAPSHLPSSLSPVIRRHRAHHVTTPSSPPSTMTSSPRPSEPSKSARLAADLTKAVVVTLVSGAVLWRRDVHVLLYAADSLVNSALGKLLKRILRQPRPQGAPKSDPGMPSSHATALSFLSVAPLAVVLSTISTTNSITLVIAAMAAVAGALLASWWRVSAGYHTVPQVVAGWAVGCSTAILHAFIIVPFLSPYVISILGNYIPTLCVLSACVIAPAMWFTG